MGLLISWLDLSALFQSRSKMLIGLRSGPRGVVMKGKADDGESAPTEERGLVVRCPLGRLSLVPAAKKPLQSNSSSAAALLRSSP